MTASDMTRQLLDYWFGPAGDPERDRFRQWWFERDASRDAELLARFGGVRDRAASGALDSLAESAEGALALVLLLDQLPRNLFRGDPRAFSTDEKARAVADQALSRNHDRLLPQVQRMFLYLPYEHSESIRDQERSVELFRALGLELPLDYALRHHEVIARFGRFPHRNATLDRPSTPEELTFLEEPGSAF